jgi:hypothetical protein
MLERVVALVTLVGGGVYLSQALALPFGSAARPGAGFFPVAVAVFACVVGLVATAQAFLVSGWGARTAPPSPPRSRGGGTTAPLEHMLDPEQRGRVIVACVLLVAFCLLLPWVGYPPLAFAFVALLLRRLGASWRGALITGVLSAAGSHYLFAVLLDVPLPRGPW